MPSKCFLEHFLRFGWSTRRVYYGMSTAAEVFRKLVPNYIHFYGIVMHYFAYIDKKGVLQHKPQYSTIVTYDG